MTITGDQTLFVNFGDAARAEAFLAKLLAQGYEGTTIKTFRVPTSYFEHIKAQAVPESMAKGSSVFQVDITKTSTSYGLRLSQLPKFARGDHSGEWGLT